MTGTALRVGVVVPAHDAADSLGACLRSITDLDCAGIELDVVVVDDRSVTPMDVIARHHGFRCVRINQGNRGAARNLGARVVRGDFVAFIDADCVVSRDWLRGLMIRPWPRYLGGCQGLMVGAPTPERRSRDYPPLLATGACVYRREAFDRVGGFDVSLPSAEDTDLAWRVLAAGYSFAYDSSCVARERAQAQITSVVDRAWTVGRSVYTVLSAWNFHGAPPVPLMGRRAGWHGHAARVCYLAGFAAQACVERVSGHGLQRPAWGAVRGEPVVEFQGRGFSPGHSFRCFYYDERAVLMDLDRMLGFELGPVEAHIVESLWDGADLELTAESLAERFSVDSETAATDLGSFVEQLVESGILRATEHRVVP